MGEHALLSPSGASRWLACTPSARLEQEFPDTSSEAADEGTLAHSLGELIIRYRMGWVNKTGYSKELKVIQANSLYTEAMLGYCEDYAATVLERYEQARKHTPDAKLFIERRLDLTRYIPEGFGTGDAIIIADHVLDFTDLKYGKGVEVPAIENRQLMVYALGALDEFDYLYDIHSVRMNIHQPRLDNFSTWEITVPELKAWAETELIPRAQLAFIGLGEYAPGEHCRFCRAKAVCKANAAYNLDLAQYDFFEPQLLDDSEIANILSKAASFKNWLAGVEDWALQQAINNGKKFPGFKLVEGKSNRKYADEGKVAEVLISIGYEEEQIYKKQLLGITAMEGVVGKKNFAAALSGLLIKPQGSPTLVPADDKRPELNTAEKAAEDFAHL